MSNQPSKSSPPKADNPPEQQPLPGALTDAERKELEQFRATKAQAERDELDRERRLAEERANQPQKAATDRPEWMDLPVEQQIQDHYNHARGTIQDYARIYKLTVEEVLDIINKKHDIGDVKAVPTIGDMISESEISVAAGDAPIRSTGNPAKPNYSVN